MVKTAVRVFPQRTTSSEASSLRHRPAVRRHAVRQIIGWKMKRPRGQRVLDGVSGASAGGRVQAVSRTFDTASSEKWCLTVNRDDSVRHTTSPSCRDCPRQVVIPDVLKFDRRRPETQIVQSLRHSAPPAHSNPLACFAFGTVVAGWCVSLLFETNETQVPRLRNFDTDPPSSYCYEFQFDNRLESVANAHTAADLHVRPDP